VTLKDATIKQPSSSAHDRTQFDLPQIIVKTARLYFNQASYWWW